MQYAWTWIVSRWIEVTDGPPPAKGQQRCRSIPDVTASPLARVTGGFGDGFAENFIVMPETFRGGFRVPPVIASAAKHSHAQQARKLDCFAALAMTTSRTCISFPRRISPGVCCFFPPSSKRGRREGRVRAAPAVSRARLCKRAHTSIQVQRKQSGLPCAMVY